MFLPAPKHVIYAYSAWQDAYEDMEGVTFIQGLPSTEQLQSDSLLILDVVMVQASSHPDIIQLFTVDVHHRKFSVIFLLQNLYFQSKFLRTLNLNSQYLILFANRRDEQQMRILSSQMR